MSLNCQLNPSLRRVREVLGLADQTQRDLATTRQEHDENLRMNVS
jgi:hypothetical protein